MAKYVEERFVHRSTLCRLGTRQGANGQEVRGRLHTQHNEMTGLNETEIKITPMVAPTVNNVDRDRTSPPLYTSNALLRMRSPPMSSEYGPVLRLATAQEQC